MIISVDTLKKWLDEKKEIVLVDARHDLKDEQKGRRQYEESHIPSAIFADMANDLADRSLKQGGRYPMPRPEQIAEMAGQKGINENSVVVIYDEGSGGMAAGRAWWMLTYIGNESVYLLDGGFQQWEKCGYETTAVQHNPTPTTFHPQVKRNMLVTHEDVHQRDPGKPLLDARSYDRFLGQNEELDAKSGHIPGATSFFWKHVLQDNGLWKDQHKLAEMFESIGSKEDKVIVYCGSGISACPLFAGLMQAGFKDVRLYPGSWSDWITHDYPIEKGE